MKRLTTIIFIILMAQSLTTTATATVGATTDVTVLNGGLLGWWPLDAGGAGATLPDHSGHGHDGTPTGNPQPTGFDPLYYTDKSGSYDFDGDDYFAVTNDGSFDTDVMTIAAWIRYEGDNSGDQGGLFSMRGSDIRFTINRVANSGSIGIFNGSTVGGTTAGFLPNSTWVHLVVEFGLTDTKIYKNGVLDTTLSNFTHDTTAVGEDFYIGRNHNPKFHGKMADVRVYDRALNAVEIAGLGDPTWKARDLSFFGATLGGREQAVVADGDSGLLVFGGRPAAIGGAIQNDVDQILLLSRTTVAAKAPMAQARSYHHAVRLNDGRILIAGGSTTDSGTPATHLEIYDPTGDSWQLGPAYQGESGTATLLADGRVLLVGGSVNQSAAAIFDPSDDTLTTTDALNAGRRAHSATLLPDGTVLVVGGRNDAGLDVTSAEIWSPTTSMWTTLTDTPQPRRNHTAHLVTVNGVQKVALVSGIYDAFTAQPTIEMYDPATQQFDVAITSATQLSRNAHDALLLHDGTLLILGGWDINANGLTNSVVRYRPNLNSIQSNSDLNMAYPRSGNFATLLPDGSVVVYGELDVNQTAAHGIAEILFDAPVNSLYAHAFDNADFLKDGTNFRRSHLRDNCDADPSTCAARPAAMDDTDDFSDYADGEFYWQFCADYGDPAFAPANGHPAVRLDPDGRCPEWESLTTAQQGDRFNGAFGSYNGASSVRNYLTATRDAAAAQWLFPSFYFDNVGQTTAKANVNTAVFEIANVHAIFGNEFLLNANRLPASFDSMTDAQIVAREIALLQRAEHQFQLSAETILETAHLRTGGIEDVRLIDWLSVETIGALAYASERQVSVLERLALLELLTAAKTESEILADIDAAIALQDARILFIADLLKAVAPDDPATANVDESKQPFVDAGGDLLVNNIGRLTQLRQNIRADLNPLGYDAEFVPLMSTTALLQHVCGNDTAACNGGLLGDAMAKEQAFINATRAYDSNQALVDDELNNIRDEAGSELVALCGGENVLGNSGWTQCNGGLMAQNRLDFIAANEAAALAWQRAEQIADLIGIQEGLAQVTIQATKGAAKQVAANELAIGKLEAYRTTSTNFTANSSTETARVEASVTASVKASAKVSANPLNNDASVEASVEVKAEASLGKAWESSKGTTVETTVDINAQKIGQFNSMNELLNAEKEATIVGANSSAEVKRLLLEQSNLLLEYEIALVDINKVVAEHNHLVEQYQFLIDQRAEAEQDVSESYANRPYWRLVRDVKGQQYEEALRIATHYAYLAAKSVEYLKVAPVGYLDELYLTRTTSGLQDFMIQLNSEHSQLGQNSNFGRTRYKLSFARHILGLTDEVIQNSTADVLDAAGIEAARAARFQAHLQANTWADSAGDESIVFDFSTLLDVPLSLNYFDTSLAGQRISGTNNDSFGCTSQNPCYGLWINMVTDQAASDFNSGLPRIKLSHGGHADYMNGAGDFVSYRPGPASIIDFDPSTVGFAPGGERLATVTSHINMDANPNANPTTPTGNLKDFSVATSQWRMVIEKASTFNQPLDVSQLNDIEIRMDAVGYPTANRAVRSAEAVRLAAIQANEPIPADTLATVEAWHAQNGSGSRQYVAPQASTLTPDTYTGRMITLDPIALGSTTVGFELFFNSDRTITGTLCADCSAGYPISALVTGSWQTATLTPTFTITTAPFSHAATTRTLTLTGEMLTRSLNADQTAFVYAPFNGDPADGVPYLIGTFSEAVDGLGADTIMRSGDFILSPPSADYVPEPAVPTSVTMGAQAADGSGWSLAVIVAVGLLGSWTVGWICRNPPLQSGRLKNA